jgi:hypothetical protein
MNRGVVGGHHSNMELLEHCKHWLQALAWPRGTPLLTNILLGVQDVLGVCDHPRQRLLLLWLAWAVPRPTQH